MKLPALLLVLSAVAGHAVEIAADYQAGLAGNPSVAPSPAALGWTAGTPTSDTGNFQSAAVSPDGATGYNAWRMLDNSTAGSQFITWGKTLSATQHTNAAARGWRLAARLRVADPVASNGGANSVVVLYGNNAAKRWILFFDLNAAGQIVTTLAGGPTVTLTGVDATQHHEHQLVYDAISTTAEYLVDGVSKATAYAGTTGAYNGVQWGTGSSGGRGDGYWNSVSFVINDPPAPPAPVATTHPQSQSVPAGGNVTLTSVFSNAPTSYQWFKNTAAVPGATAATLSLTNVAATDAGDYWCRAINATGSAETATAALEILTTGAELTLNEFLAENDHGLRDEDGDQSDWIELHNPSTAARSTADYFLTDDPALPAKWPIPAASIPAGGFLRIWASGKNRTGAGDWHTNFSLQNSGGYLALVKPDLTPATAYTYPAQFADDTFGLTVGAAPAMKFFATPSPLALNSDGQTSVKDGLAFVPPPGTFSVSTAVTLTSSLAGGTVRYAIDGTRPTFDSLTAAAPVSLTSSTNLRAAVLYPGERYGATATGAYLRLGADVQAFSSPLPILLVSNHGAGAVPGVSARGPNGDGSDVVGVPLQAQNLLVLDEAAGNTGLASPVVDHSRAGLKIRGSSSFVFAEKSYSLETWGEFDNVERDVSLAGLPADSEWVIYGPDPAQFDVTLIHNTFSYELARQSGFNAPRFRFVELFLDSGGDLTMADHRGLAILMEKPSRGKDRVDFKFMNAAGTTGGWMINVDRMDSLPPGSALGSVAPRHFHSAGPDRTLQTPDDNPRGYQGILTPGGAGSGSGITPANDDMPNFYHSFFNFESPGGWSINPAQRGTVQTAVRNFDAALYGPNYLDVNTGYWPQIDAPNWAQHLILQTFTKNQDGVVLSGFLYRETPTTPLRWASIWDFDRSFTRNPTNSSATANLTWAHDRLYYQRLVTDPEFMQAYIDKWQALRRGALATANMQAIVDAQAAEITSTVAARSGLSAATWTTNLTNMKTWLSDRAAAMDALYTAPPVFSQNGGDVPVGFSLTITAPGGTIYYTTDGSDPRLRGGTAAGTSYSAPVTITDATVVTARAKVGSAWSGLTQATFYPPQDLNALKVTEIHYHPADDIGPPLVDGVEFEFLEFKNTGSVTLDLAGLSLTGVTYTFPATASLAPGQFWVIVRNPTAFAARHPGVSYQGVYTGKLDNGGESLGLWKAGAEVWSFPYGDSSPWSAAADGGGLSLQRPAPAMPGYDVATWSAATPTPGADLSLTDSDGDGMPDFYETLHGFSPNNPADGPADADGDSQSNAAEYAAGTDAFDPASVFLLTQWAAAGGGVALEFTAIAGRSYTVQFSTNLANWQSLAEIPAGPLTRSVTVPDSFSTTRRFYRAITPAVAGGALLGMGNPPAPAGPVAVAPVFADHMVLQREMPLPVWGSADPGVEVTVHFGSAVRAAVAGADGKWVVKLPPQSASAAPQVLRILKNGTLDRTINDVLVGEVWLCAGQSNMEFRLNQEATWGTEQSSAAMPELRLLNYTFAGQGVFAASFSAAQMAALTPDNFYTGTWTASSAASAGPFSAVGYFFGKELLHNLNVPIGLINIAVGGSPAEAWMRRDILTASSRPDISGMASGNWLDNPNLEPWCKLRGHQNLDAQLAANPAGVPGDDLGPNHHFKPAFLWDAGPARLKPFAIRGVTWYQGESNALSHLGEASVTDPQWRLKQHEALFPMLVSDWRTQWGQGDFPFLITQLSSIDTASYDSHFWPEFRDQQRRASAAAPNLGIAVTSDIGNATNVHPTNKHDVGKRLAAWALRYTYQDASALPCPLPDSAVRDGSAVVVSFRHAGTSLTTSNGQPPATIEIAGSDGVFQPATATISGNSIRAQAAAVSAPARIRYGWQPFSLGNLANASGFPLSTFNIPVSQ